MELKTYLLTLVAIVIIALSYIGIPMRNLTPDNIPTADVAADLPFIKNIDYKRYEGLWYEIASLPNALEKNCKCAQSLDALTSQTHFDLHESCLIFGKNITSKSSLAADAPGLGNFTNWNGPISAPYWVIDLDYLYRWVVIGQPSRKGYWIQSRTKTLEQDLVDGLNKKWSGMGFNLSNLEYMDQSCSN
jgi:apolipoprotein D and lipocalin family protein